jgi:hypothetical protein
VEYFECGGGFWVGLRVDVGNRNLGGLYKEFLHMGSAFRKVSLGCLSIWEALYYRLHSEGREIGATVFFA